jgi:carboxypeptidase C (cathepsin A)
MEFCLNIPLVFRLPYTLKTFLSLTLLVATAGSTFTAIAQEKSEKTPEKENEQTIPVPAETTSVTHHELSVSGQAIHYTATAGNLLINDEKGKPNASIFYVAYTKDGSDAATRPVTFFYNGGPGAASIWLHMGSFGPVRVITQSPEATGPAPFKYVPNDQTLLDKSDLVFVDAPLCGFSRAVGKGTIKDFAGVDQDVAAFHKFIARYITANQRWGSPKFLFGESYGTPRSAALVASLQDDGIEFNGVVLLSSILNYGIRIPGYDTESLGFLPSYAAIAWHYNKVPHSGSMEEFVEQARQFDRTTYAPALAEGDRIPPAEFDAVAQKLASFTGLSVPYLKESKLRVSPFRFRKELLRGEERTLGRYDARFMGYDVDSAGETPGYDPSDTGISGTYVGAFHDYLQRELKYASTETYNLSGPGVNEAWDWKHRPAGGGPGAGRQQMWPDTAIDLSDAMRKNPHLKVFSANGWFDLATPFYATEWDLSHMGLPPALLGNVTFGYYPAGHMVYLNVDALKQMRTDLGGFYNSASKP